MARTDPAFIKNVVRGNFDRSVSYYDSFEDRYHLFAFLTRHLAGVCGIRDGKRVLDVGCGTGTSSVTLAGIVGKSGHVVGVDFSREMLRAANARAKGMDNLEHKLCDANALTEILKSQLCTDEAQSNDFGSGFDAVLYNACIFLVPEPENTLGCAHQVLLGSGMCGMNYIEGVFSVPANNGEDAGAKAGDGTEAGEADEGENEDGIDLFTRARRNDVEFAPYGRGIVDVRRLPEMMRAAGFVDVRRGTVGRVMSRNEIEEFYGIPAQSAGLYPRTAYEERLVKLGSLFDHYEGRGVREFEQRWGWVTGRKKTG